MELVELLAPLGVGGVLAGVMFYFYRHDRLASEKRWHGQAEILAGLVERNTTAITALVKELERPR